MYKDTEIEQVYQYSTVPQSLHIIQAIYDKYVPNLEQIARKMK